MSSGSTSRPSLPPTASLHIDKTKFPSLPTQKALLLIDFQNDFVSKDGALHVASTNADFVERAAKLADGFRDVGLVIWVQTVFEKPRQFIEGQQIITREKPLPPSAAQAMRPGRDQDIDPEAFLSTPNVTSVQRGTLGWQLATPLKAVVNPRKDVLLMKTQYSAFNGTKLIQILRSKLVTTLYVCGSLINVGVHATTVDAAAHGYSIILVRDCCGWSSKAKREAAIANLTDVSGCEVVKARSIVATITGPDESDEEKERLRKKKEDEKKARAKEAANRKEKEKKDGPKTSEKKEPKEEVKPGQKKGDEKAQTSTTESAPKTSTSVPTRPSQSNMSSRLAKLHERFARTRSIEPRTYSGSDDPLTLEVDPELVAASDDSDDDLRNRMETIASIRRRAGEDRASDPLKPVKRITRDMKALKLSASDADSEPQQNLSVADGTEVVPNKDAAAAATAPQPTLSSDKPKKKGESTGNTKKTPDDGITKDKKEVKLEDGTSGQSQDMTGKPPTPQVTTKKDHPVEQKSPKMATTQEPELFTPLASCSAVQDSSTAVPINRGVVDEAPRESEPLCEGDTKVIYNILPPDLEDGVFEKLKDEIDWKRMSHLGGEVPRLVAVQGHVEADGSMPVYRHPADESPPLKPFSATVLRLKEHVEKHLGHTVNHVLIQLYRDGKDYISEHSDKTLDIVKGSSIANLSLGAERTMVFRTKRPEKGPETAKEPEDAPRKAAPAPASTQRQNQRARLPHNSLCRMGLKTNERWLHAIRQDKRPDFEKTAEEMSFGGERISLTFRDIGTFLDADETRIWGQGATAKIKEDARPVINGDEAESERIVRAFGVENRLSNFDWEKHYGGGFDVLHMTRQA
ncbi:hypothetical protein jhhlp_006032 [Lomentospora prolificans]|uniref:Fe2OG dioxygenase domain-containing protein n=1 Tax=Lomentospora prolificans TaxID=41688 RepID=A0A2N3N4R9_9PEZI|nr:hypothetical protein jhhlp_006032 [Lomentospora prolificans]